MDERRRFLEDHTRALYVMTELCARHGISGRRATSGWHGLRNTGARGSPIGATRRTPVRTGEAAPWYTSSPRPYPARLPALEYPGHFLVKPVTAAGNLRFKHKLLFIAHALAHHRIGFDEVADGVWSIYFGTVLLGRLDERTYTIHG